MARGQQLYNKFTADSLPADNTRKEKRQGRSAQLHDARNLQILHRYYYHARLHRLRYELVLDELVKEFSLSTTRLVALIGQHSKELDALAKAKPSTAQLTKLYPHFSWR